MEIKIEKNIPRPSGHRGTKVSLYPFAEMDIGDSIFIPDKKSMDMSGFFSYHRPKKFSARGVNEKGIDGVRVWRVL